MTKDEMLSVVRRIEAKTGKRFSVHKRHSVARIKTALDTAEAFECGFDERTNEAKRIDERNSKISQAYCLNRLADSLISDFSKLTRGLVQNSERLADMINLAIELQALQKVYRSKTPINGEPITEDEFFSRANLIINHMASRKMATSGSIVPPSAIRMLAADGWILQRPPKQQEPK